MRASIDRMAAALTVGQKAMLIAGLGLLVLAAAVGLTAAAFSLRVALLLWSGGLVVAALAVAFVPLRLDRLQAQPRPAAGYLEALARFERDAAASSVPLNPLCHPELLVHGAPTRTAIVLLHGISSCPRAFVDFAPMLFARGHNVVSLRMPENGYANRSTDALKNLTAEELVRWGDLAVDVAVGLGDEVVILGISAGGTVAAWAAQNRPEVDRAVLVAPMIGLSNFGAAINGAIMRLTLRLPDFSIWKDPVLRERLIGMPHAYKRQSSRATGELLRLGAAVMRQAGVGTPLAQSAALVLNANDRAIDNGQARRLADLWSGAGMPVTRFEFPASLGLGHEIIDPLEPGADPAVTYPVLVAVLEGREPPSVAG